MFVDITVQGYGFSDRPDLFCHPLSPCEITMPGADWRTLEAVLNFDEIVWIQWCTSARSDARRTSIEHDLILVCVFISNSPN